MSFRRILVPVAVLLLNALTAQATLVLSSTGIDGYSGNPGTNGGQICNACHSGGNEPRVTLSGPLLVEKGSTSSYSLLIQRGQKVAGGLDVSTTAGTLVVTDGGTKLQAGELTHTTPRAVDANGDVKFDFDWTAPNTAGTETMYGAGNSVNRNFLNSGDRANKDQLVIQVVDCLVKFSTYGAGTPGAGGFVPALAGTDNQCSGGYTVDVQAGLGGATSFLWIAGSSAAVPFACGNVLVNFADPLFVSVKVKLSGPAGVPGAGTFQAPGPDVSALAGLDLYLQALILDAAACQGIALSNGLVMDIG